MSTFSDSYIAANAANLPAEALPMLRERLNRLDESQTAYVLSVDLKSPTTALIFSILLGSLGADRFYIGQTGLGVAKLALTLVGWLTLIVLIGGLLLFAVGVWQVVDWFLIMNATKRANLEKLNLALASVVGYH